MPGRYPIAKIKMDCVKYDEPNEKLIPRHDDIDFLMEPEPKVEVSSNEQLADIHE